MHIYTPLKQIYSLSNFFHPKNIVDLAQTYIILLEQSSTLISFNDIDLTSSSILITTTCAFTTKAKSISLLVLNTQLHQ